MRQNLYEYNLQHTLVHEWHWNKGTFLLSSFLLSFLGWKKSFFTLVNELRFNGCDLFENVSGLSVLIDWLTFYLESVWFTNQDNILIFQNISLDN